jgi:hypothetical protein
MLGGPLEAGMSDYLAKPDKKSEFATVMGKWLFPIKTSSFGH